MPLWISMKEWCLWSLSRIFDSSWSTPRISTHTAHPESPLHEISQILQCFPSDSPSLTQWNNRTFPTGLKEQRLCPLEAVKMDLGLAVFSTLSCDRTKRRGARLKARTAPGQPSPGHLGLGRSGVWRMIIHLPELQLWNPKPWVFQSKVLAVDLQGLSSRAPCIKMRTHLMEAPPPQLILDGYTGCTAHSRESKTWSCRTSSTPLSLLASCPKCTHQSQHGLEWTISMRKTKKRPSPAKLRRRDQYLHPGSLPQALPPGRERPEREKPKLSAKGGWSREQENDVNKILEWKADRWDFSFLPTAECSWRGKKWAQQRLNLRKWSLQHLQDTGQGRQKPGRWAEGLVKGAPSYTRRRGLHLPQYLFPAPPLPPDGDTEGFHSPGVWLPQLPSPSAFVLLSKHRQPASRQGIRRILGNWLVQRNWPTYSDTLRPPHQGQNRIPSSICETCQETSSASTWGLIQLLNASLLQRTGQLRFKVIWGKH